MSFCCDWFLDFLFAIGSNNLFIMFFMFSMLELQFFFHTSINSPYKPQLHEYWTVWSCSKQQVQWVFILKFCFLCLIEHSVYCYFLKFLKVFFCNINLTFCNIQSNFQLRNCSFYHYKFNWGLLNIFHVYTSLVSHLQYRRHNCLSFCLLILSSVSILSWFQLVVISLHFWSYFPVSLHNW